MSSEPRIFEAEVVPKDEPAERKVVEHVTVKRIPGGAFIGRALLDAQGDPAVIREKLRDLKFKLWLWLTGFALISGACVYGAFATDVVIFSAFLLVAAAACAVAVSFVWLVIWAVRRVPVP